MWAEKVLHLIIQIFDLGRNFPRFNMKESKYPIEHTFDLFPVVPEGKTFLSFYNCRYVLQRIVKCLVVAVAPHLYLFFKPTHAILL